VRRKHISDFSRLHAGAFGAKIKEREEIEQVIDELLEKVRSRARQCLEAEGAVSIHLEATDEYRRWIDPENGQRAIELLYAQAKIKEKDHKWLGAAIGVSMSYITKLKKGRSPVTAEVADKILAARPQLSFIKEAKWEMILKLLGHQVP
jgi:hypothetical protein